MVTFPTGLLFTSVNTQRPFSIANVFGVCTTSGQALNGGTFTTGIIGPITHSRVPGVNGRRRIAFVFA